MMESNEYLSKHEFITYSISAITILVTLFIAIITALTKSLIDKAKIVSLEDNKELELEVKEMKNNYIERFDLISSKIQNLEVLIERKFAELNTKIEILKKG